MSAPGGRFDFISIHALREEGDARRARRGPLHRGFLSTPSARRATRKFDPSNKLEEKFLSTPSARRATSSGALPGPALKISIHALREEGDCLTSLLGQPPQHFYPRPPRGGRRRPAAVTSSLRLDFYPRPPRGGRQAEYLGHEAGRKFLSTPSARRATEHLQSNLEDSYISIHALREEGDISSSVDAHNSAEFLSTPSARRATRPVRENDRDREISIHALREEGDTANFAKITSGANFYPRPPRGGRLDGPRQTPPLRLISIHALREEGDDGLFRTRLQEQNFYPRPPRGGRRSYERQHQGH